MNRTLLLMAVAAVATSGVKAQSVTYNHDSPKQNQITVMETGTGALSPELYYTLLHNKYKKSAASKNKLSFRTLVRQNEILVGYLARRQNATATDGLLNVTADRTLDKSSVVRNAMSRWNESRLAVRGSQSDGGIGTGDGDETVNRGN